MDRFFGGAQLGIYTLAVGYMYLGYLPCNYIVLRKPYTVLDCALLYGLQDLFVEAAIRENTPFT
jgi:hypothetical protein